MSLQNHKGMRSRRRSSEYAKSLTLENRSVATRSITDTYLSLVLTFGQRCLYTRYPETSVISCGITGKYRFWRKSKPDAPLIWNNSIQPILRIKSGETVTFDCLDASNGQITPSATAATISSLSFSSLDQVNGPIYVEGAFPGDTLKVEVLSIETADWGWTACIPGFGLLSDEYPEPALKIWKLDKQGCFAYFDESKRIKIPLKPFAGEMGVARGEKGAFSTIPPYNTGGNIDTKHVTAGATLYLPIEVEGALFSVGDGHAAQGDGGTFSLSNFSFLTGFDWACRGTAIETPISVELRLSIIKDRPYTKTPHFQTAVTNISGEEYYCTTGVEPDLREAARAALRHMITYLGQNYNLDPVNAYMLCSIAGDLRIHELVREWSITGSDVFLRHADLSDDCYLQVDMPNYVVGMMMPKSIFI
ncbi:hypothetical protein D9757_008863 [Collybiopsis confluens]|uniref:Formamidase n=1 Tax=Collybiopsis confluens TaxID=2823264 RepID=A0A8H5H394_9AGAR|nr:hypothetical protein D9757_008863 [Collybiopsis confluens]